MDHQTETTPVRRTAPYRFGWSGRSAPLFLIGCVVALIATHACPAPVQGTTALDVNRTSLAPGLVVSGGVQSLLSPGSALRIPSDPSADPAVTGPAGCFEGAPSTHPVASALAAYPNHPGWPVSVVGGASPPVCADLDPAVPGLEILVGTLTNTTNLYAFHQDGSLMSGYPLSLGFWIAASPSIGDIDGDGAAEIVIGDFGGNRVWALEANGAPLPGWPISVGANVRSTAALADLDPTFPGLEIIVGVQDGTVQAWHADGTSVPGWPVTAGNFVERCSPAVGDVNGDGFLEVFVGSWYDYNPGSTGGVYGFDHAGNTLPGWPKLTSHVSVIASPALADLDGDGQKEITTNRADLKSPAGQTSIDVLPGQKHEDDADHREANHLGQKLGQA
jgi:hypothetical protein